MTPRLLTLLLLLTSQVALAQSVQRRADGPDVRSSDDRGLVRIVKVPGPHRGHLLPAQEEVKPQAARLSQPIDASKLVFRGGKRAPITVVTWVDYQCPFTQRLLPTLARLREEYPEQLRFAVKNLPQPFHANANVAARAVSAARVQGKLWEFHDALFAASVSPAGVVELAQSLQLDVKKFETDLGSPEVRRAVEDDLAEAAKLGVVSTPTTTINGLLIVGPQPLETFREAVEAELERLKPKPVSH